MAYPDIFILGFDDPARRKLKKRALALLELMQCMLSIIQELTIAKDLLVLSSNECELFDLSLFELSL